MNGFVSAMDAMENQSYTDQKAIRDEIAEMRYSIRRTMDRGLTPDEMPAARGAEKAALAAENILEKIFN